MPAVSVAGPSSRDPGVSIRPAFILKTVAFLLGCLCTALLAFALYVWLTLDVARLEAELVRQVAEHSKRSLRIDGGLRLAMWPRPALRLAGAQLTEPDSEQVFAELGPTRLSLAVGPLVWRRVVIEHIELQGGSLQLQRRRDGSWNGADLAALLDRLAADSTARLALDSLVLRQGALHLRDEGSGLDWRLSELTLRAPELRGAWHGPLQLGAELAGSQPGLTGKLQLTASLQTAEEEGAALRALAQPVLRFSGRVDSLQEARLQLGAARLAWGGSHGLHVEQLTASLAGQEARRVLDLSLDLPQLRWQDGAPAAAAASASLSLGADPQLAGDQASTLRLAVKGIAPTRGGFGAANLSLRWALDSQGGNGAGGPVLDLAGPLRYEREGGLLRLDDLRGEARLDVPWLRPEASLLRVAGAVAWRLGDPAKGEDERPGRLALDFSAGQDTLRLEGRLAHLLPLDGQLDLGARNLNLDAWLAAESAAPVTLPLAPLQRHKASGRLKVDQVQWQGRSYSGLESPYSLNAGRLELADLRIAGEGSKLGGKLSFDAATRQLGGQFKFDKLDLQVWAQRAGLSLPLAGRADGSLSLEARGDDSRALRDSLMQTWQLRYALPLLDGIDLARSLRELQPAWQARQAGNRACEADERTELAALTLSARITGQTLHIDKLEGSASWLALAGDGQGELGADTLRLNLRSTPTNPAIRSFTRDLGGLKGIAIPLLISHNQGKCTVALSLP